MTPVNPCVCQADVEEEGGCTEAQHENIGMN